MCILFKFLIGFRDVWFLVFLGYVELGFILVIMGLLGFGKFIFFDILVGD